MISCSSLSLMKMERSERMISPARLASFSNWLIICPTNSCPNEFDSCKVFKNWILSNEAPKGWLSSCAIDAESASVAEDLFAFSKEAIIESLSFKSLVTRLLSSRFAASDWANFSAKKPFIEMKEITVKATANHLIKEVMNGSVKMVDVGAAIEGSAKSIHTRATPSTISAENVKIRKLIWLQRSRFRNWNNSINTAITQNIKVPITNNTRSWKVPNCLRYSSKEPNAKNSHGDKVSNFETDLPFSSRQKINRKK